MEGTMGGVQLQLRCGRTACSAGARSALLLFRQRRGQQGPLGPPPPAAALSPARRVVLAAPPLGVLLKLHIVPHGFGADLLEQHLPAGSTELKPLHLHLPSAARSSGASRRTAPRLLPCLPQLEASASAAQRHATAAAACAARDLFCMLCLSVRGGRLACCFTHATRLGACHS